MFQLTEIEYACNWIWLNQLNLFVVACVLYVFLKSSFLKMIQIFDCHIKHSKILREKTSDQYYMFAFQIANFYWKLKWNPFAWIFQFRCTEKIGWKNQSPSHAKYSFCLRANPKPKMLKSKTPWNAENSSKIILNKRISLWQPSRLHWS